MTSISYWQDYQGLRAHWNEDCISGSKIPVQLRCCLKVKRNAECVKMKDIGLLSPLF